MADRTVRVNLRGDVSDYTRSVERAALATRTLKEQAEQFSGRTYRANLDIRLTGASLATLMGLAALLERLDRTNPDPRIRVRGVKAGIAGAGNVAGALAAIGPAGVTAGVVAAGGLGGLTTITAALGAGAAATGLAMVGMGDLISAMREHDLNPAAETAKKLAEAQRGMAQEAVSFARTINSTVRPAIDQLKRASQQGFFPGAEAGMREMLRNLPAIEGMLGSAARAMGQLAREAGEALGSPRWREFFDYMEATAGPILISLGRSLGNLIGTFRGLAIAFGPLATDMASGLERITDGWNDWAAALDTNQGFQEFIAYVRQNGPVLMSTLKEVGRLFMAIVTAAMPVGSVVLPIIRDIASALANVMESDAGPVIMGIVAALGALKVAAGISGAVMGLAGAFGRAGAGARGASGAMAGLGGKVGAVGLAAAGAAVGWDYFNTSVAETKTKMEQAGQAGSAYRAELRAHDEEARRNVDTLGSLVGGFLNWKNELIRGTSTTEDARRRLAELRSTMTPLEVATSEAAVAQGDYDDAVIRFGQNSPQAVAALQNLHRAQAQQTVQQRLANQSGVGYYQTLARIAQEAGPAGDAARRMAGGFDMAEVSAMGARVEVDATGQAVAVLPDGKRIAINAETGTAKFQIQQVAGNLANLPPNTPTRVSALTQEAQDRLRAIGLQVTQMPDGSFEVVARTEEGKRRVHDLGLLAQQGRVMPVGANAIQGRITVQDLQGLARTPQQFNLGANGQPANATSAQTHQNASLGQRFLLGVQPGPANAGIADTGNRARTPQTMPHLGNPADVNRKVIESQNKARLEQTMPHLGNPNDVNRKITDSQNRAREQQTMPVDANTGPANSALSALQSVWDGITWTVNVVANKLGFAAGGIAQPYAAGGIAGYHNVVANAPGNTVSPYNRSFGGKKLRTMQNTGARMVGPNTWRVVGDRLDVPELYAPLDGSGRSLSLIAQGAATFGKTLVDTAAMYGREAQSAARATPFRSPHAGMRPVAAMARAMAHAADCSTHNVTVNAPIYNPVAERGSASVQSHLSRPADLGLFGSE